MLCLFLDLARPSREIGELFEEKGQAILALMGKLGYSQTRKRLEKAIERHLSVVFTMQDFLQKPLSFSVSRGDSVAGLRLDRSLN